MTKQLLAIDFAFLVGDRGMPTLSRSLLPDFDDSLLLGRR
jgi:hypothetical protein